MIIRINNPEGNNDHLSIPKNCWEKAIKEEQLTRAEFCLFLYLANHADKKLIDLNRDQFEEVTGYKKTAYNDALRTLKEKGYLIQKGEYQYDFYIMPFLIDGKIPEYMFGEM